MTMLNISTRTLICSTLSLLVTSSPVWCQNAPAIEDPFSAPASVPASPFGDSPAPVSPFGGPAPAPASAVAPANDPFAAAPAPSTPPASPFSAAPAPAAAEAPSSPFAAAPENDPLSNATGTPVDPFAPPAADAITANPNPFNVQAPAPGAPGAVDPFAPATTTAAQPVSPFGAPAPAAPVAANDPFGGTATPGATVSSPFNAPASTTAAPQVAADPFGGSTPAAAAPASPFGDPAASGAPAVAADPFGGSAPATPSSPFGDPSATSTTTASPFGNPDPTTNAAQPTSPFGAPAPAVAADSNPFETLGGTENIGSPFGGGAPASPFGGAAAGATTTAAPATDATGQPASPFGGPAAAAGASSNPFASSTSTTTESPFGGPAAATAGAPAGNPFATGVGSFSPFASGTGNASSTASAGGDVNPEGIQGLSAFRFELLTRWDGTRFVTRKQLSLEEAKEFDRLSQERYVRMITSGPGFPGYDGSTPADIWAEWCHYSDQLELWSQYVDNVVLAGTRQDEKTFTEIQWPGAAQTADAGQPGAARPENIINYGSQTSIDDQTSDLIFGAPSADAGAADQESLDPSVITKQVVLVYNNRLEDLRSLESDQESFYIEFLDRLADRKTKRLAYADWRNDQERQIEDSIIDWNRRYNGSVANIGGVRYELYRPGAVPENVQRDSVVVVTEFDLTPFDILNPEDGTLKE
jgi:hypothetical protein